MIDKESGDIRRYSVTLITTVIAVAVMAYLTATCVHEILGHGGVILLLGGKPLSVSTTRFDYDKNTVQAGDQRIIAAAGSLAKLTFAGICFALLRFTHAGSALMRYFLWLSMNVNIFIVGSYLLTPFIGQGDWARVVAGTSLEILWKGSEYDPHRKQG